MEREFEVVKNTQKINTIESLKEEFSLSDTSPLGRLYDLDANVLLLGVPYENNTSFHLGEYKSKCREEIIHGAPIYENGVRVWKEFKDIDIDCDCFNDIGKDFERAHEVIQGKVGNAHCKLFSQRDCVDFATKWLSQQKQNALL